MPITSFRGPISFFGDARKVPQRPRGCHSPAGQDSGADPVLRAKRPRPPRSDLRAWARRRAWRAGLGTGRRRRRRRCGWARIGPRAGEAGVGKAVLAHASAIPVRPAGKRRRRRPLVRGAIVPRDMALLELETHQENGSVRLALSGELDISSAPRVEEELTRIEADPPALLVLDLRGLAFMDSTGLR